MPTIEEKLQQARALIDSALDDLAQTEQPVDPEPEPEPEPENPGGTLVIDEGIIQPFADVTVSGLTEHLQAFSFDGQARDLIVIGKCQLAGVSGECAVLSIENEAGSWYHQIGIGYDFSGSSASAGRVSLRGKGASTYTTSGVGGLELVSAPIEFLLHYDTDRGYLNLWLRDGPEKWKWADSVRSARFQVARLRFYNRTNGPTTQQSVFTEVVACRPLAVSIGDSITAGHNAFDPDGAHYSGRDNGLSQWQAHCWPFPGLRNSVIVNKGIGGTTTAQTLNRISEAHKHGNPVVFLSVQNNDAVKGVSLEQRTANIHASINACVAAGCVVVLIGAIYHNDKPAASSYYKQWRDEHLPLLTGHVGYVEIMEPLAEPITGDIQPQYTTDGTHPNVAGYTLIGQKITTEAPWFLS